MRPPSTARDPLIPRNSKEIHSRRPSAEIRSFEIKVSSPPCRERSSFSSLALSLANLSSATGEIPRNSSLGKSPAFIDAGENFPSNTALSGSAIIRVFTRKKTRSLPGTRRNTDEQRLIPGVQAGVGNFSIEESKSRAYKTLIHTRYLGKLIQLSKGVLSRGRQYRLHYRRKG